MFPDLEKKLNCFDPETRINAVKEFKNLLSEGKIPKKENQAICNMHCHSFFSYNGYGFSPSYIAYLAKKEGWFAAGIVDFDVLDGVDEFVRAAEILDLRYGCGMETRVFIPELSEHEINSPGEPGISYHMGIGFTSSEVSPESVGFLGSLKDRASTRTRTIVAKVNAFLNPLTVDFEEDVLPLTPAGNATERHVCEAYSLKAGNLFRDKQERINFWSEKLGTPLDKITEIIDNGVDLQALIRSKTMKSGGPGYAVPKPENFPGLKEMNEFILKSGAIPALTWLNGESSGESDPEKLIELHLSFGAAAVNIIPDRNWNYSDLETRRKKVAELDRIVKAARKFDLPLIAGTEMNAPGQKLVDDFSSEALKPYAEDFIDGAAFIFAHSMLNPYGFGYSSEWAENTFNSRTEKKLFFSSVGKKFTSQSKPEIKTLISGSGQ